MDALEVLKHDHDTVKSMFQEFEKAGSPDEQRRVLERIFEELETHTRIEEEVFYPAVRSEVSDEEDTVRESLEEHHVVDTLIAELRSMDPSDEQYEAKATVLMENVEHHIEEEEDDMFPSVREAMDSERLGQLGDELQRAKGAQTGGGDGATVDLTRDDLYERARELDISGRSEMNKEELAKAVRAAER